MSTSTRSDDGATPEYIDSDIIIWHLRGRPKAQLALERIAQVGTLTVAAMQLVEVRFFLQPNEETAADRLFSRLAVEPLTEPIVRLGAELYKRYHPSHGLDENDALLAPTAMVTNGTIHTLNVRHFPMPGLRVERGWD